ncbi:MAG: glycosyltransferase [Clostridia bacterium]|nr:glycosyltransferase [Clostridia bacterium]
MAAPKVSIIVPVYKTEAFLERCLASVRAQTLPEIEIILVDDGSPDNCPAMCDAAAKEDARIRVIHKENGGLGNARNSGMQAATGEYIGFVDSDDFIDPEMYENLYLAAKKHEADVAISGICFVGGNMFESENAREDKPYFETETVFSGKEITENLMLGVIGALPHEPDDSRYGASVCKNLFRREMLRKNELIFLSERDILSEDTVFMVDVLKKAERAVGVPGAHYCYFRNGESLSKSYNSQRFEKSMVFLRVLEERIRDCAPKETYGIYLDRLTQGFGRVLCSQEIMHAKDAGIPYRELKQKLRAICTRKEIRDVLRSYPWHKLPLKQAVFACLMRYRLYRLQQWIVILRDR